MNANKYDLKQVNKELQTKLLFIVSYLLENKENIPEQVYKSIMRIIEGNN